MIKQNITYFRITYITKLSVTRNLFDLKLIFEENSSLIFFLLQMNTCQQLKGKRIF